MRLARLPLIGLGAVAVAFLSGHQAKANTAYMWGEAQREASNGIDTYSTDEVFLLNVDLNTGAYTEVSGSRKFVRTYKRIINVETETNPSSDLYGSPDFHQSNIIENKIYFIGRKRDEVNELDLQKLSYFDLSTNEYGFALDDGNFDSEPVSNIYPDFFPTAATTTVRHEMSLIGGQGLSTGNGGSEVDLTPVHARIDVNEYGINSNKDAIRKNKKQSIPTAPTSTTLVMASLHPLP